MDILAHGLWSNTALYYKYPNNNKQRLTAVLFGVLPDIIPFTPSFFYLLFAKTEFDFYSALHSQEWFYVWGREAYNFTHSFIIFIIVAAGLWVFKKNFYWPILAWGLHILMDLFTHPDFFKTPFLFPISDYKIAFGIDWGHPIIMIPQYAFFAGWYSWWILKKLRIKNA